MQPEVTAAVMHLKTMWWPRKSECEAEKEAASTVCSQSRTDSPPDQTSYTHSSVSNQLLTADLLETKSSLLLPLIFYLHQHQEGCFSSAVPSRSKEYAIFHTAGAPGGLRVLRPLQHLP